jgi:hypothetical protein
MKLYADTPARRTRQLTGDLVVAGWLALWVWLALELRERLLRLRGPGEALERAGGSFSGALADAGDRIGGLPVVGDDVSGALRQAGRAGDTVAEAGRSQQHAVEQLALWLPLLMLALAAGLVLVRWLPTRLAWAREAGAATRALSGPDAVEVFAVRALARRSVAQLATLPAATVTGWGAGLAPGPPPRRSPTWSCALSACGRTPSGDLDGRPRGRPAGR